MRKKRKERENRTIKLTARTVDSLKPDPERQLDYFDQDLKSFCVRVSPSGHKSFCVFYRRGRQLRRHTLGSYPVLTLAQAREKAKDALHEAHHGADPGEEKQRARQAATFAELSEQYIERYAKKKKRTWEEDQRIVNKYLLPEFEHVTANDLSRASVRSLLEEIAEDAPIQANRVLATLRKIYSWGVDVELLRIEANPFLRMTRPAEESERDRVLTEDELKRFWTALETEELYLATYFKVLTLTAQRADEVRAMHRSEIDGEWWTIPGERTKNGKAHRVWLAPVVRRILDQLEEQYRKTEWIFPSPRRRNTHFINYQDSIEAIRSKERANIPNFKAHDLRRTAASMMASMGIPRLIIGKVLNHTEPGVTGIYDRHSYDAEKKDALDRWAAKLMMIVSGLKAIAKGTAQ